MFRNIAYTLILGKPLIMWGGIITLISFLFTAYISYANQKGNHKIPFKWHSKMAVISLIFALIHGLLGILANF